MINELKNLNKLYQTVKHENDCIDAIIESKGEYYEDPETTGNERKEIEKEITHLEEMRWENTHKLRVKEDKIFKKYIEMIEDPEDKQTIKQAMSNVVRRENILTKLMKTFVKETAVYTCC